MSYRFFCTICGFELLSCDVLPMLTCQCGCLAEHEELEGME